MYGVIVRENKIVAIVGILNAAAGVIFLILSVGSGAKKRNISQSFFCSLIFGGMLVLGLLMLASYFLRRLCLGYTDCYYQTMFGRKTGFALRDIKKVEQKTKLGEMMLILWGSNGKRLAQVEMNMKNAEKILPFLKEYQLPAIERDPVWKNKENWENMKKMYGDYKRSTYYPERQRNYRKVMEKEWGNNPAVYQSVGRISHTRLQARILNVLGIMAVFIWGESFEKASIWFMLYPLLIFGFYIAFPRVLIWDINTRNTEKEKRDYVQMPVIGLGVTLYCGILKLAGINVEDTWKMAAFGIALSVVLVAFLLLLFKRKRILELGIPICFLCIYCFISSYYWNCALAFGEPEHIQAEVVEKRTSDGGNSSDHYYFKLRTGDGKENEAEVIHSLYESTRKGESVLICRHESIFGIHYYYVHI